MILQYGATLVATPTCKYPLRCLLSLILYEYVWLRRSDEKEHNQLNTNCVSICLIINLYVV